MPRLPALVWMLIIAGTIVFSSAFMFLVTTFLFAFSGGTGWSRWSTTASWR